MEALRQDLLQATCRWLEAETRWDVVGKAERESYERQRAMEEERLRNNRFQELLQEHLLAVGAAEDTVSDEQRRQLYSQVLQETFWPQEGHFAQHLQAAHLAYESRAETREERKRLHQACKKAEAAQAGSNSLIGLQLQRRALHQVQRVFEDSPGDIDAMWATLSKARSAGVATRDLSKYENMFVETQAKQGFQVQLFAISDVYSLEVTGTERVGELRQRVADKLRWRSQRTLLLFSGKCLMIDSQTLHECGVTQESCDFAVAQIKDEIEDSHEFFQNQTNSSEVMVSVKLKAVGLEVPKARHQPETVSTMGKPIQRWTFELIKVACHLGIMDFTAAASLHREVEDGLLCEDQARMTIRTAARSIEGIEGHLEDVDKKYIVQAQQAADEATSHLSSVEESFVPVMQKQQAYSDMVARELRSWGSSSLPSARNR